MADPPRISKAPPPIQPLRGSYRPSEPPWRKGLPRVRPETSPAKILVALKRAVEATFTASKWRELAYLADAPHIVEHHPRLLRSLGFKDDDYPDHILGVLRDLARPDYEKLPVLVDAVGLEEWLRANDPALFEEIYRAERPVTELGLGQLEKAAVIHDVADLNRHVARIRKSLRVDPEQAIGSAKELLETVLKTIVGEHDPQCSDDIPRLLKRAQLALKVHPTQAEDLVTSAESFRKIYTGIGTVVLGVAEVRNLHGTGHGRCKSVQVQQFYAELAVNAAVTAATFLLELWAQ